MGHKHKENAVFIVLLKITGSKERAAEFMAEHRKWLQSGFDDGVFLASGSLQGQPGGAILVHGIGAAEMEQRLSQDPFVIHDVVVVEIVQFAPSKADPRLTFLLEGQA